MTIISTDSLTRRFGQYTAVDALTLTVESGEVFGLLGPNGAGKSTTHQDADYPAAPDVGPGARWPATISSRQPAAVRRSIGYVPQALSADGNLTGYENLLIFAKLYDLPRAEQKPRIREALDFMGLADAGDKLVRIIRAA